MQISVNRSHPAIFCIPTKGQNREMRENAEKERGNDDDEDMFFITARFACKSRTKIYDKTL